MSHRGPRQLPSYRSVRGSPSLDDARPDVCQSERIVHVDERFVAIGAGEQSWSGWLATQREQLDLLDESTFERFFGAGRAQSFLCEHTWEHLTVDEGVRAARLCWRFLQDGGRLRVAVPDGRFPDDEYQRTVQVGGPGPADHPAADHKVVYVAETLVDVFERAGFDVSLIEWWDAAGRFCVSPWSH